MAYTDFIMTCITNYEIGKPIYSSEIAHALAEQYGLTEAKASAAVAVAMKRIVEKKLQPNIRFYQKGIYYLTDVTPFGEVGINTEQLIVDKYLLHNQGYEAELTFLYRLGMTTQVPRSRELVTNHVKNCARFDQRLGVIVRPPKTEITADNKLYLQLLDALEKMDKAPIDAAQPYRMIAEYIQIKKLHYETLLALADQHYAKGVLPHLAHTAREGGTIR